MRKVKSIIIITLFTLVATIVTGAEKEWAHHIKVQFDGTRDTLVYLANYYGKNIYRIDSTRVDQSGVAIFKGDKTLQPGIYLIYLNGNNFFEFLIGNEQHITVEASFSEPENSRYKGATETVAFSQYQKFLTAQRKKQLALQQDLNRLSAQPDSLAKIRERIKDLNREMDQYWNQQSKLYNGTFLGDFYKSMIVPEQPPFVAAPEVKNSDSLRWATRYNFLRNHYWDNLNFGQTGFLRTPILDDKLEQYFKHTLLQIPDSIVGPAIKIIEQSKANPDIYQYILLYLLNLTNQSEIMGMESVFVTLAKSYVISGEASFLDSTTVQKITEKVYRTEPNLIGKAAPEIKLPDIEGNYYSLRQTNGPITVLYFWEPNCGHCQKTTPQLFNELYLPLRTFGVEVYSVCIYNNMKEWSEAIGKYGIHEWTNVWDPANRSDFRQLYDITTTPVIYLLDKQKRIIAKRIDVPTAVKIIKTQLAID